MAQSLEDVKRQLRDRLQELRPLVEEYRQLERAADALGAAEAAPARAESAPKRRASKAASRGDAKRAPRGENKRAVFQVIAERPGVSVGEIAQVTKIGSPLVYGVTRNGVSRGELEAVDLGGGRKGFKLADAGAGPDATGSDAGDGRSLEEATEGIEDPTTSAPVGG